MKAQRLQLQTLLENLTVTEEEPTKKLTVYFQPPSNLVMKYPCIVYQRDDLEMKHADNSLYNSKQRYQVTYISGDPDADVPDKLAALPLCRFSRFFVAENLNHDVYDIYF